ncbi:MAG: DoxX family protein [Niabella sp.]
MAQQKSKAMNISLWIAQGLLAAMFLMAGTMKSTQPIATLAESMPWVSYSPAWLVRFVGISELLGGLGLILPALLRIQPKLTVYAAIGLAIIMVLAMGLHAYKGEFSAIGMNVVILLIAVFIAWGRTKKVPILPKS